MALALQAKHIFKYFHTPEQFEVLKDIALDVQEGEFVCITGKSGSGKSTLLYILSTMDTDYQGTLLLLEQQVTGQSQNRLAEFRNRYLGFVFQFHYLLPDFSCLKNVMLPALRLGKYNSKQVEQMAYEKLEMLGVADQALKPASKISGGQQQRVAIARALINDPAILMCDEPTGNLDTKNTVVVFDIFRRLSAEFKKTIITVTHDVQFAGKSDRVIDMMDGKIIS